MINIARLNLYVLHLGLILCSFYQYTDHAHVTESPCSWGSWLSWDCSCCGNSREITVYRIRIKCCAGTIECGSLRIVAEPTSKGDNFADNGSCMDKCFDDYRRYNSHSCYPSTPKGINMQQITHSNKTASCRHTCIGGPSPTVAKEPTVYSSFSKTTPVSNASSSKASNSAPNVSQPPGFTNKKTETATINKSAVTVQKLSTLPSGFTNKKTETATINKSAVTVQKSSTLPNRSTGTMSYTKVTTTVRTQAAKSDSSVPSSGLVLGMVVCRLLLLI